MRKKIKLIYWRDVANFGDYIGPFLVERLSGIKPMYKRRWWGYADYFKELYRIFRYRQWHDLQELTHPFEKTLLSVGSILKYANPGAVVWGSGFMSDKDYLNYSTIKVSAVRGCKSANKLNRGGGKPCGDPALLLPEYLKGSIEKRYLVGIIPHWSEYGIIRDFYPHDIFVIDPRTSDIEEVVNKITACEYIVSSSLHGIIIAHTYGIPALWFRHNKFDDGFKYLDYFSSVQLEEYEPLNMIPANTLTNRKQIETLFENYKNYRLPNKEAVKQIRYNLHACFPYKQLGLYSPMNI